MVTIAYKIILSSFSAIANEVAGFIFPRLQQCYKSGLLDSIIDNKPRYLLLNEMVKLSKKGQTFLLNLIEIRIAKTCGRLIDNTKIIEMIRLKNEDK